MRHFALFAVTALALPAAAQTTTLDVTLSHAPLVGGFVGDDLFIEPRATVLDVEASRALGRVGGAELRLGGVLRAATTDLLGERGQPALHHAEVRLAGRRVLRGGTLDAFAGLSLDSRNSLLDRGLNDGGPSRSTNGVHALRMGVRGGGLAEGFSLAAGADVSVSAPYSTEIPVTNPEGPPTGEMRTYRLWWGHLVNLEFGASRRVGAVEAGVGFVSAQRTAGRSRMDGSGFPDNRIEPATVVSVVPSVTWRRVGGLTVEAALRSPGVLALEHAVLGVPVVVSGTRVPRLPLSLRVGYAW